MLIKTIVYLLMILTFQNWCVDVRLDITLKTNPERPQSLFTHKFFQDFETKISDILQKDYVMKLNMVKYIYLGTVANIIRSIDICYRKIMSSSYENFLVIYCTTYNAKQSFYLASYVIAKRANSFHSQSLIFYLHMCQSKFSHVSPGHVYRFSYFVCCHF